MPQTLHIAVCICNEVTISDFVPPMEIIAGLNHADNPMLQNLFGDVPYRVKIDYLAPTLDPIKGVSGLCSPLIMPTKTYGAAMTDGVVYDVIWVPAGPILNPITGEDRTPPSEIAFIRAHAPRTKYVMSVCLGSAILAWAGVLSGKRATTNKALFKAVQKYTPSDIFWVTKARWVIDGNIWTSSGVSAGSDMAIAFLEHIVGPRLARIIRGQMEVTEIQEEDDPFAAFHNLV